MAKARKRDPGVRLRDRETNAPQLATGTTAANGDRERIAERAYQLYIERGGRDGRDLDDWLEAERELARRGNQNSTTSDDAA